MAERVDEKWNGVDLPIYHFTKKTGKTWWVSNIGSFSELVPLILVRKILGDKDTNIKDLEGEIEKLKDFERKHAVK